MTNLNFIEIPYKELLNTIFTLLTKNGLESSKSQKIAEVLANTTLDGINSHGINRLPLLIEYIKQGYVSRTAEPKIINTSNIFCQVDGNFGLGILNALYSTDKAIEIASRNGVGLVSLKNTNHWHRAGSYGWRVAEKGMILIAWTNTIPNLAPYGSKKNLIGNNPLVIAIPNNDKHLVLDMALSQYSYGKIATYSREGKTLPEIGGYNKFGVLTKNANEIRSTGNHLPIGFWKGAGLSLVLDLVAAILSGGKTTKELGDNPDIDRGMSQVFIVINPKKFGDEKFQQNLINETLANFKKESTNEGKNIRYPGEGVFERRKNNLQYGIPIEKEIWENVLELLNE